MSKKDFEFDVDETIKEAEDAYDYSDLVDLSLLPKREKKVETIREDEEEDELEEKASKGLKILGIVTLILIVGVIIACAVVYLTSNLNKNSYASYYNSGVEAYEKGDYSHAVENFEQALTFEEANNIVERLYLYNSYKSIGEEDKGIECLEDLLHYDPYNEQAIIVVSDYYNKNGELTKLTQMVDKYTGSQVENLLSAYMLEAPSISHESGNYNGSLEVVLFSSTGDNIYYTLDGTDPSMYDQQYTEPIHIGKGSITLKAVVINSSGVSSEVSEAHYEIEYATPDIPEVEPASGSYSESQKITIKNLTDGVKAYYTLDGSVPTTESEQYLEPIDMPSGNKIFSVVFINEDNVSSDVVKRNYNLRK